MRGFLIAMPLPLIVLILFAGLSLISIFTRRFVRSRRDPEDLENAAREAYDLRIAATFAIFSGFAMSICWGAVTVAQTAVEDQATAIHQAMRDLQNIPYEAESARLKGLLKEYATVVADRDTEALRRGETDELPSAASLDKFHDAVVAYVDRTDVAPLQAERLLSDVTDISSASARVEAVASRVLPSRMGALVFILGVLSAVVMAIAGVNYQRPRMIFIWNLVVALSVATVIALAYPFALRSGTTLEALRTVAHQLSAA